MCGIIAIAGQKTKDISDAQVGAMLLCLAQRGPDDKGFERLGSAEDAGAVVGQTRLSIVDLSPAGHQPMRDNTNPLTIVFNGEIYGYKGLCAELEKRGHRFSSQSDTEVILKAYAEYGRDCVQHIDGMFAFAIWDDVKKELFVARDQFGKKPLYYASIERTGKAPLFVAASEIKSIFASGLVKGIVDPAALDDYLRLMYVPSYRTIYSNIHMLPPAHAGIVKDGSIETWRYWDLEKKKIDISYEDAKAKLKELLDAAVKKRMVADVEIGSLLSGGVDSTIVTLYAQKYSKTPVKTFSVGYEGTKDESAFALEASKKIGTDHYPLRVNADLADELEKIVAYMDEPHGDTSNFPQHLISGLAASKVKVALTGDGADELFMGYGWYQKHWHTPRWKPSRWFLNPFRTYRKATTIFGASERRALLKSRASGVTQRASAASEKLATAGISDPIGKINAFDLKIYLPGQLFAKIDRTSMMHSLEVRSPFLDTALAEFVYSLPTSFKLSKSKNKIILKDILAEVFPREFVDRRKQGFGAPVGTWLAQPKMKALVDSLFAEGNPAWRFLDRNASLRVSADFYKTGENGGKLWSLVCLLMWFNTHNKNHLHA
ncbi:MAG TPA: asparagine synthase (glutamine-hydrolyzing) [Candidatus Paceibacterota bacterium]|nr:asparagine synthase (glutamine-hydrolyzing) [Candidatus Paceibacterota bacterium]